MTNSDRGACGISRAVTMAGSVLEIEPGAMRELHRHPNGDEWQYHLAGTAEMGVDLAEGTVVTEQFEQGDVGYAPMGARHYIRNTGGDVLRVLIGFNNGIYEQNDISTWIASNPKDILAANLGLAAEDVEGLPQETVFMTQPKA
jgi:oxalate decarboxylase